MSKQFMRYGASPRGLQAIILAAKIRALLEGRYAVAIDDIRHVASPALRHRLILNFEGEAEGIEPDAIIAEILQATKEV
jgi:MoxR-like ATPase